MYTVVHASVFDELNVCTDIPTDFPPSFVHAPSKTVDKPMTIQYYMLTDILTDS